MKKVFHGKRTMKTYYFEHWDFNYTLKSFTPSFYKSSESFEKLVEMLERMINEENFVYEDKHIYIRYDLTRHNEVLDVPETSYTPNIGETITVAGRDASVLDKKYDADTDTMHIYTDIVLATDTSRYESTKEECARQMISMINKYLPQIKEYERFTQLKIEAKKEEEKHF
ncbi:hypothetical protein PQE70_gp136 [Bacillus phage vB_BanS_Nate]|uniref:Uncharacterized protein n=1 Tax=Bacillus phage vB_BanS_Nate TaxID=2894788 RepID=A0AAE8YXZ4_9CAUD|nr:hypothetical protein PQE70_gp136 [Bacillus phage vB_BanS_Nate]UGO50989.1 hypothetical protein NATE_136 [Bacillus phage vB_BanS_Nate]